MLKKTIDYAREYVKAGLSVIPIKPDGTKAPAVASWKEFEGRIATYAELDRWFVNTSCGIAIIGGGVSGYLEIIDFDDRTKLLPWATQCRNSGLSDVIDASCLVRTPTGGFHVYIRCAEPVEGNTKLAFNLVDGKREVAIETRGEGGYVLAPGSPKECHPSGREYVILHGDLLSLPIVTKLNIDTLHAVARSFDAPLPEPKREKKPAPNYRIEGLTPWEDYDRRGDMREILRRHGWTLVHQFGNKEDWCRPGKSGGTSATIGYCTNGDTELLYVFSGNASPFCAGESYGPYRVYSLLEHDGDPRAAAGALARMGYGDPIEFTRRVDNDERALKYSKKKVADTTPRNHEILSSVDEEIV